MPTDSKLKLAILPMFRNQQFLTSTIKSLNERKTKEAV